MNFFNRKDKEEVEETKSVEVTPEKTTNFEIEEGRSVKSNPFLDNYTDPNSELSKNLQQVFGVKEEPKVAIEPKVEEVVQPVVQPVIRIKPQIVEKTSGVRYEPVNIMDVSHITQTYDKGKTVVFDDFSLEIKDIVDRGQFVTILGQSGCGKCFTKDSFITIRSKKTGKIEKIESYELIKRLRQPD